MYCVESSDDVIAVALSTCVKPNEDGHGVPLGVGELDGVCEKE